MRQSEEENVKDNIRRRTSDGEHKQENIRKNIIMRTSDEEYSKKNIGGEY